MPLDKYKQKRNFQKTPEPAGSLAVSRKAAAKKTDRFFCVQKHLASHLHYDLRLELNGVLLSWAVPKGPSLDPKTKRLAMKVEDHPFDYGEFEGVIPEGYGAGIVMLWDRGTWTPESPDIDSALKKGDLKFTLDGYKLKGSWVLVRTKGPRWSSGGAPTCWRGTPWAMRCWPGTSTRRLRSDRAIARTWSGCCSWTHTPASSTWTGTAKHAVWWPASGSGRAGTPTTNCWPRWSASCR